MRLFKNWEIALLWLGMALLGGLPICSIAAPALTPTVVSAPVVVFPLRNATGDAGLDWVAIGLQDSLTVDLWYVSALETKALPQFSEVLRAVCPDLTLACVAEQSLASWREQARAQSTGGFLWGDYRREGETLVLRLGWYGLEGEPPLAEQTLRGNDRPALLSAATEALQALLAARGIPVTEAEQVRIIALKTAVAAAWEQNARGYWEQIQYGLASDDAQHTARAADWEQHLRAAVQADSDYAEAWNNLGWQRLIAQDYPAAQTAFERALHLKPTLIDALIGRGSVLQAQNQTVEALTWYEQGVALNLSLLHRQNLLEAYQTAQRPEAGLAQLNGLDEHLKRHQRDAERQALHAWRIAYHTELKQWPQVLAAYQAWDAALASQPEEAARTQRLKLGQQLDALGAQRQAEGALKEAETSQRLALSIREAVHGPDHLEVAHCLRALAKTLQKQQRPQEAEPLLQRLETLLKAQRTTLAAKQQQMGWEQLQGPARDWWDAFIKQNADRLDVVLILFDELARLQVTLNDFFEADQDSDAQTIPEILQALEKKRGADATLQEARQLAETGKTLYEQGRYPEAEEPLRRALTLHRQALPTGHPDIAASFNNLALWLQATGRFAEAEPLLREALAIKRQALPEGHPDIAASFNNLAALLKDAGRFAEAEPLLREALAIRRQALPEGHPAIAISLNNLAALLQATGRFAEAEPLLREALAIKRQVLPEGHPDMAISLNNLALLLQATGRLAEAEPLLRKALVIKRQALPEGHSAIATSLDNLAALLKDAGRLAEAEPLLREALAIHRQALPEGHPDMAISLNNLALLLKGVGRFAEAEPLLREGLAIHRQALPEGHSAIATSLNNLATLLQATDRLAEAEPLLREALAIKRQALPEGHPDIAASFNNLALLLQDTGRFVEAEPLYRKALAMSTSTKNPMGLVNLSGNFGHFLRQQNRLTEAIGPYDTAVQTLDQLFAHTFGLSEEARHTFIGQYAHIYHDFIDLLLKLHGQQPHTGYDRKSLEVAARQQSRVFTELLRQSKVQVYERDPVFQDLKGQRDSLRAQVVALTQQHLTVLGTTPEADAKRAHLSQGLEEKRQVLQRLDERLRLNYPRFAELEQPAPVTVEAIQALLQPGEAVWSVVLLPEQTALFVITRNQFRLQPVAVSRQTLTNLIAHIRQPLETAAEQNNLNPLAGLDPADLYQLHQHLIAPVADLLQKTSRVLVVADGPLYTLPLELLVTRFGVAEERAFRQARKLTSPRNPDHPFLSEYATLDYLDGHHRFHYLPSLAALVAQRRSSAPHTAAPDAPVGAPSPTPELIAFADPIFGPETSIPPAKTAQDMPTLRSYSPATEATLDLLTRSGALKSTLPRLPETANEARAILTLLKVGSENLYLRDRAQEQTLYDLNNQGTLRGARYVLFSTHGLLGGELLPPDAPNPNPRDAPAPRRVAPEDTNGREPALALTLVGDLHGQDGFLKMGEVLGLNLSADLVVLSACNTAGEVKPESNRGEGFVGLTRAFLFAGAHRLLVSHWSVDSVASRDLMIATFTRLRAGQAPADALAEARRQLRQQNLQAPGSNTAVAYAHPFFWAPFVVVGD